MIMSLKKIGFGALLVFTILSGTSFGQLLPATAATSSATCVTTPFYSSIYPSGQGTQFYAEALFYNCSDSKGIKYIQPALNITLYTTSNTSTLWADPVYGQKFVSGAWLYTSPNEIFTYTTQPVASPNDRIQTHTFKMALSNGPITIDTNNEVGSTCDLSPFDTTTHIISQSYYYGTDSFYHCVDSSGVSYIQPTFNVKFAYSTSISTTVLGKPIYGQSPSNELWTDVAQYDSLFSYTTQPRIPSSTFDANVSKQIFITLNHPQ